MRRAIVVLLATALAVSVGCNKRLKLVDNDEDAGAASASTPVTPADTSGGGLIPTDDPTETSGVAGAAGKGSPGAAQLPATCAGYCEHALRCVGSFNDTEMAACIPQCAAQNVPAAKISELNRKSCPELIAFIKGQGKSNGNTSSSGGAKPASNNGGCNDCATCVFDGTSCYSRVPPFLACNACCCRKGGPAPRWE